MGSKKKLRTQTIRKKTRRPGARRSKRKPPTPTPPPCLASMGCLCAGHARSPDPTTPCDTTEHVVRADCAACNAGDRSHAHHDDTGGVCCTVCGSMDVEYACWVNPNTNEVGEAFGSWNAGDNTYCRDCDTHGRDPNPSLVDAGADPDEFLNARSKRLGDSRSGTFVPPKYDDEGQRIDEHGKPIDNDEGEWT